MPIKTHFLKQSCSLFPILIKRAVYKVAYSTFLAFLVIFEDYYFVDFIYCFTNSYDGFCNWEFNYTCFHRRYLGCFSLMSP